MASRKNSNRGGAVADMQTRAAETRTSLVEAARTLFAEVGYHATGTSSVVARANVTRGALYHHFRDKQDLFEAVFRQVAIELNEQTSAAARRTPGDTWQRVVEAFATYLRVVASSADVQRILLIDGPTVLGWQRWRELQYEYIASGVVATLQILMQQKVLPQREPEPLAWLIQAALADAALGIANAGDKPQAEHQAKAAFIYLLEGLRRPA